MDARTPGRPTPPTAAEERESRLAALLETLLAASRRGELPPWDRLAGQHPDLIDELRELWGTALLADGLGSSLSPPHASSPGRASTSPARGEPFVPRQFGDYELLEELGRGGMGVVYKARQRSLGRTVAIKLLLRGEQASDADLARFRAEAAAAAHLDPPNIIPVYEVGEVDGQPFFSMKYVAGTTLARELAGGPLESRAAARLMVPVAQAVAAAHRRGVLHRDIKPSNILVDEQRQPLLTDFGLAKRQVAQGDGAPESRSLTSTGAILGTPSYMAPEQAAGQRGVVGPASDVYSLGAVLYQMVTGRPPFQAPTPVDTLLLVLDQDPLPPRLLNPQVDPDLEMIVLKCLQKPADLRYPSAEALAADLQAFLQHEPISARTTNLGQIVSRMLRETHHAAVLENWGLLWMWHSLVLLVLCLLTNWMHLQGVSTPPPYMGLWCLGLGLWIAIFWRLRHRAGPITFVERQIAHVWAGSVICSTMLFFVEILLHLPVLTLSPVLSLLSGFVFLVKAGTLSGAFYLQAGALFATSALMAEFPDYGQTIFGVVSALCFFIPGWKYHRQRFARQ